MRTFISIFTLLAFTIFSKPAFAEAPMVMIKLDDLVGVTPKWQQVVDFLEKEDLKANFGIMGSALEKEDKELINWVKKLKASGRVEFWNHGYAGFGHRNEFSGTGFENQRKAMERTQELSKQRFGEAFAAFGPHSSPTDADTYRVLALHPEIKLVWFYGPPKGEKAEGFNAYVVPRVINLENPIFHPNPEAVQKGFEKKGRNLEVIGLQGHPATWGDQEFEDFKKTLLYLKQQGCRFVTISEVLAARKP